MSSRKPNCKWTVSFSATSQIHFIGNLVFISRDRFFTVCQASALDEVCSVALLTGSAGWPDCCLVSEACSHMSAVQLTHPLFCTSSIWQDPFCLLFFDCYSFLLLLWARFFFLFLFCVYSLATHHPTVPMTVDRWLVDAGKRTCSWSLPKMLFCRWIKCETRTRMQKKKRKKNSDSECCEIYFPQHYSLSPYCLIIQAELWERLPTSAWIKRAIGLMTEFSAASVTDTFLFHWSFPLSQRQSSGDNGHFIVWGLMHE